MTQQKKPLLAFFLHTALSNADILIKKLTLICDSGGVGIYPKLKMTGFHFSEKLITTNL
jgi:hypothetical protein